MARLFRGLRPREGANDVFPTYENGDVFLAWAEYGIRAYAPTHLALKYLRRIVERYKKDGLAFQRYLRKDGQGAGDDILANNGNALTGLYRDLFRIQPKPNRLYLEPHLVPDMDGTRVDYDLRGRRLGLTLSTGAYEVRNEALTVRSFGPFGVDFGDGRLTYFAKDAAQPALAVAGVGKDPTIVSFGDWTKRKRWTVSVAGRPSALVHTFYGLRPGVRYAVLASGKPLASVSARQPTAKIPCAPGRTTTLKLVAVSARYRLDRRTGATERPSTIR